MIGFVLMLTTLDDKSLNILSFPLLLEMALQPGVRLALLESEFISISGGD